MLLGWSNRARESEEPKEDTLSLGWVGSSPKVPLEFISLATPARDNLRALPLSRGDDGDSCRGCKRALLAFAELLVLPVP